MVLDGELSAALHEAVEWEKGLRQRGKTLAAAIPATTGSGSG
jgi:hypothetical protein